MDGPLWYNCVSCSAFLKYTHVSLILSCSYARVAYCDVMGRESRLPLRIKGEGLGPHLHFSFDVLDIQSVFVNSGHAYEVEWTSWLQQESCYRD